MLTGDTMRCFHELMILSLLTENDSYGYALAQELESRCQKQYAIRENTLYALLARLEKQGYIASYEGHESQGRPRTYFAITRYGRRRHREKCAEWQAIQQILPAFVPVEPED